MFFKKRFKIDKDMIPRLYPTSKVALKQMCLIQADGDLEKAQKLYDYMIKDLDDLPIFDPVQPSTIQQVSRGVNDTFNWVKENQEEIFTLVDMVKGMFSKKPQSIDSGSRGITEPVAPIPPIN